VYHPAAATATAGSPPTANSPICSSLMLAVMGAVVYSIPRYLHSRVEGQNCASSSGAGVQGRVEKSRPPLTGKLHPVLENMKAGVRLCSTTPLPFRSPAPLPILLPLSNVKCPLSGPPRRGQSATVTGPGSRAPEGKGLERPRTGRAGSGRGKMASSSFSACRRVLPRRACAALGLSRTG
jgi:hypothetical protein